MSDKINLLLVEDSSDYQLVINTFLRAMPDIIPCTVSTYDEAVKQLAKQSFDIALLDIDLGEKSKSGLEVAKKMREEHIYIPIIFLTNNFTNAYYEVVKKYQATSFLDKQLSHLKIRQAIELALNPPTPQVSKPTELKHLLVKVGNKYKKISVEDIDYFYREGGGSYIVSEGRKYPLNKTVTELESIFHEMFIRIHQSYLVNLNKVIYINTKDNLAILEGIELPIGTTYRKKTMAAFTFLN